MTASDKSRFTDAGLLALRLGAGSLLFFAHGWPKLAGFAERSATFADPLHVGSATSLTLVVFAEVICAGLVMLGLATRLSAIPVIVFLMVAAFVQHADDPWNKKEFALIYAVPFVALALAGAGRWSVDALISRARARPRS